MLDRPYVRLPTALIFARSRSTMSNNRLFVYRFYFSIAIDAKNRNGKNGNKHQPLQLWLNVFRLSIFGDSSLFRIIGVYAFESVRVFVFMCICMCAILTPLGIVCLCMQTNLNDKKPNVMNGNGYRLTRIAKMYINMKWNGKSNTVFRVEIQCAV